MCSTSAFAGGIDDGEFDALSLGGFQNIADLTRGPGNEAGMVCRAHPIPRGSGSLLVGVDQQELVTLTQDYAQMSRERGFAGASLAGCQQQRSQWRRVAHATLDTHALQMAQAC